MIETHIWIVPTREGNCSPADPRHWIIALMEERGRMTDLQELGIMTYQEASACAEGIAKVIDNMVVIVRALSIREYATYLLKGWKLKG